MLWVNESPLPIEYWKIRLQLKGFKIKKIIEPAHSLGIQKEVEIA